MTPSEPTSALTEREYVHAIETGAVEVSPLEMVAATGTTAWARWREQLAHMLDAD